MATMLQAAWRAAASQSSRAHLASMLTAKRCLSDGSSGNGRYVAGQGFVAGEGYSQDQWPPPQPPTHGGFVPHSVDSYAQAPVPPTQGGFVPQGVDSYARAQVPATQGGFVDQARTSAPQDGSYVQADYGSYQYGYDYSQYGAAYGAAGFAQAQPYPMQHGQGQFVVDGSAWPPLAPPPLVAPPYPYPLPPPPPPPAEAYQPGTAAFQSQAAQHPYVQQEYASQQQEYAPQQTVFQAQEEQGSYASQQAVAAAAGTASEAVESVADEARAPGQETQLEQPEQTNVAVAAEAVEDARSHDETALEEHGGYDASAAAMADAGVLSEDHDSHQEVAAEEPEEPAKESSPPEVPEAPKPAAPTSSQGNNFVDILAKANLNIRQNKPRPQLGIRNQRKTYARLHNLPRQILKSDVINYFSELNLQNESVHVTYDDKFYPLYVQIAFDSSEAMRNAQKILQTKGRLGGRVVKMESFVQFAPASHAQISEAMKDYLGRMLLVLHLPQEGRVEDLERFFDGYGYDPAALTMLDPVNMTLARFSKEGNRMVRRAAIGFLSSLEAMRALREKQGDFMLNEPVELRLIQ